MKIGRNIFTKDNKILVSDNSKTVSLYNISGEKLKTYTCSNDVKNFSVSSDGETLIVTDTTGVLNVYNISSTSQIGYIPNFGSKKY